MQASQSPNDLAKAVGAELRNRRRKVPTLELLVSLFEAMYFASLQTEEAEPIHFQVTYLNPKKPDPNPPARIVKDRWSFVPIQDPIPLTVSNVTKVASASDPRSSSFVTYPDARGKLLLWGLVDQQLRRFRFQRYESEYGPEVPGLFQARISGTGHVVVSIGYQTVAELKVNVLAGRSLDVLRGGPVRKALSPGICDFIGNARTTVGSEAYKDRDDWDDRLAGEWISVLCRLLLRVQNFRHGGAILITPDRSLDGLNLKFAMRYDRLATALHQRAISLIRHTNASDRIFEVIGEFSEDSIPTRLYLDEAVYGTERHENRTELDGAIWFVALLTRVDGLVLMTQQLEVTGFGVEITVSDEPSSLRMATDRGAAKSRMRKLDYNHFGTRHRSMMRYCATIPGSVGFVVSQDGDVRVMTEVRGELIVWERPALHLELS